MSTFSERGQWWANQKSNLKSHAKSKSFYPNRKSNQLTILVKFEIYKFWTFCLMKTRGNQILRKAIWKWHTTPTIYALCEFFGTMFGLLIGIWLSNSNRITCSQIKFFCSQIRSSHMIQLLFKSNYDLDLPITDSYNIMHESSLQQFHTSVSYYCKIINEYICSVYCSIVLCGIMFRFCL